MVNFYTFQHNKWLRNTDRYSVYLFLSPIDLMLMEEPNAQSLYKVPAAPYNKAVDTPSATELWRYSL